MNSLIYRHRAIGKLPPLGAGYAVSIPEKADAHSAHAPIFRRRTCETHTEKFHFYSGEVSTASALRIPSTAADTMPPA